MHTINIKDKNILLLSDTHGRHRMIDIPADIHIVIHAGDICTDGNEEEIQDFFEWYDKLTIPHKIFVHGNHDLPFELEPEESLHWIPRSVIWLNDSAVTIMGIRIIGISAFPFFKLEKSIEKYDIIISHYPPLGILDNGFGFPDIGSFVDYFAPSYHVFGHNHSHYGIFLNKQTQYINASLFYQLCQKENL